LSTLIFAAVHIHHGGMAVFNAAAGGVVYGAAFCWLRRFWPIAIAHSIHDFVVATRIEDIRSQLFGS